MSGEPIPAGHRHGLEQSLRAMEASFIRYMEAGNWATALDYIDQALGMLADSSTQNCDLFMAPTLEVFEVMSETSPINCYWCSRLAMPFYFAKGRALFHLERYEEVSDAMYCYADIKDALERAGETVPGPELQAFSHHPSILASLRPLEASFNHSRQRNDWQKVAESIGEALALLGDPSARPGCFWCKLLVLRLYKVLLEVYFKLDNRPAYRLARTDYDELKEVIRVEGRRYCD